MTSFIRRLIGWLIQHGTFGLVVMGVLDSSFLFLPLGNDLLMVGLTAQNHGRLPLYAAMAALGSTLGCLLLDLIARKGGEEGLKKIMASKRLRYLKKRVGERAGVALAVACLAPPPFPFTTVVAAASAFNYPRSKLLLIVAACRLARFTVVGLLAVWQGRRILALAKSSAFEWGMLFFIAICAVGSAVSIYKWSKNIPRRAR
jgi:membrane protein YqaA with SNARE-associated domain